MNTDHRSLVNDPEAIAALLAVARRERAREVYRLLFAPLIAFLRRPKFRRTRASHSRAYC